MAEESEQMRFDASEILRAVEAMSEKWNKHGSIIEKVTGFTVKYNEAGEILSKTVSSLAKGGEQISRVYEKVNGAFEVTSLSVKKLTADIKDGSVAITELMTKGSLMEQMGIKLRGGRLVDSSGKFVSKSKIAEIRDTEAQLLAAVVAADNARLNEAKRAAIELETLLEDSEKKTALLHSKTLEENSAYYEKQYRLALESVAQRKTAEEQLYAQLLEARVQGQLKLEAVDRQALADELADHTRRMALYQKETAERVSAQEALGAKLANARAQSNAGQARNYSADFFTNQALSGVNLKRGNAEQIVAVTNAVDTMAQRIRDGSTSASRSLEIMQSVMQKTGTVFSGTEKEIANDAVKLQSAISRLGKTTQDWGDRWKITVQDVARFVQFRVIYSGLFALTGAMKQSVTQAQALSIKIGEIQTISQGAGVSTAQWSEQLRRLSDALGQPVEQVAGGVYETISNQIAKGADAARFMGEAMRFAATTVSTTEESVNLLSSALNTFGLDANNTNKVAAVLFKTIDLGRVRASEMANNFGRMGNLAKETGVSFEELNAAVATLTISGIKYNVAATLITNVLTKLNKPTKEMQKLFQEWGVASGESAIKTFGFVGVLRKLQEATGGSATEMAGLFKDIRAIQGAIGLTGDAFGRYEKVLTEITADALPAYAKAQEEALTTPGFLLQKEMNQIRNFFINDFGVPALNIILKVGDAIGGSEGLSGAVATLTRMTKGALEIFILWKAQMILTTAAGRFGILELIKNFTLFEKQLHTVGVTYTGFSTQVKEGFSKLAGAVFTTTNLITAAIVASVALYERQQALHSATVSAQRDATESLTQEYAKFTQAYENNIDRQSDASKRGINEVFQQRSQSIAQTLSMVNRAVDQEAKAYKVLIESVKDTFDLQIGEAKRHISDLERIVNKATDNAKAAARLIEQGPLAFSDRKFGLDFDFADAAGKIDLMQGRIKELRNEAKGLLTNPNVTPEDATKNLEKAERDREKASQLLEDQAKKVNELTKHRVTLVEKISDLEDKMKGRGSNREARDATVEAEKQLALIRELEKQRKTGKNVNPQIKAAQERLAAARDAARATGDSEQDRSSLETLQGFKDELKATDDLLKKLPSLVDARKQLVDLEKESTDNLAKYQAIQENIAKNAQTELDTRRKTFEGLKTAFADITKIKVPKDIKTVAQKDEVLKTFDTAVGGAINAGLSDQGTFLKLQEMRVEISRQADAEIARNTISSQGDSLQHQKEQFVKHQDEITAGQKDVQKNFTDQIIALKAINQEAKAFAKEHTSLGKSGSFDNAIKNFEDSIRALEATPGAKTLNEVAKIAGNLQREMAIQAQGFSHNDPNKVFLREPTIGEPTGRSIQDVANDTQKALSALIKNFGERKDLTETQNLFNKQLAALGITPVQLKNFQEQQKAQEAQSKFSDDYRKGLKDTATALTDLTDAISKSAAEIRRAFPEAAVKKALGGPIFRPSGTDTVPAMLTPGEFVINANATKRHFNLLSQINSGNLPSYFRGGGYVTNTNQSSTSTTIGDIHVHGVPVSGNVTVDAKSVAIAVKTAIRQGFLEKQ